MEDGPGISDVPKSLGILLPEVTQDPLIPTLMTDSQLLGNLAVSQFPDLRESAEEICTHVDHLGPVIVWGGRVELVTSTGERHCPPTPAAVQAVLEMGGDNDVSVQDANRVLLPGSHCEQERDGRPIFARDEFGARRRQLFVRGAEQIDVIENCIPGLLGPKLVGSDVGGSIGTE